MKLARRASAIRISPLIWRRHSTIHFGKSNRSVLLCEELFGLKNDRANNSRMRIADVIRNKTSTHMTNKDILSFHLLPTSGWFRQTLYCSTYIYAPPLTIKGKSIAFGLAGFRFCSYPFLYIFSLGIIIFSLFELNMRSFPLFTVSIGCDSLKNLIYHLCTAKHKNNYYTRTKTTFTL